MEEQAEANANARPKSFLWRAPSFHLTVVHYLIVPAATEFSAICINALAQRGIALAPASKLARHVTASVCKCPRFCLVGERGNAQPAGVGNGRNGNGQRKKERQRLALACGASLRHLPSWRDDSFWASAGAAWALFKNESLFLAGDGPRRRGQRRAILRRYTTCSAGRPAAGGERAV
jgi:hypothetical protein